MGVCQYGFAFCSFLEVKTLAKVASPNKSPRNTNVHRENFLFSEKIIHDSQKEEICDTVVFFHFLRIDCVFGLNKRKLQNKGLFEIFTLDGQIIKLLKSLS